jgi:hypothetical protein
MDKHSSLILILLKKVLKKFNNIGPRPGKVFQDTQVRLKERVIQGYNILEWCYQESLTEGEGSVRLTSLY